MSTRARTIAMRCITALTALVWATGAQPARADQTIAIVGSISDDAHAIVGGVDLAIADINAKGGLLGQKLRSQSIDDACDPEQTEAAAQLAISMQPVLVIGHSCSASSILAEPLYARANIIQMAPMATNSRLTEMGLHTVFRMIGRDDDQGLAAAERIAATWPHGKIAVLDDGEVYGKGLADIVRKTLRKRGIPIAMDGQFKRGAPSYAGLVRKLAKAGVQAAFLSEIYGVDVAVIAREAAQAHLRLTILSGDTVSGANFWTIAGKAGESTIFTFPPNPLDEPAGQALRASARKRGVELEAYNALGFTAVEAWAAAVAQVGSFRTDKVAAALHAGRFETSIGPVWFNSKGDIQGRLGEWIWYRWRDGKMERVPNQH